MQPYYLHSTSKQVAGDGEDIQRLRQLKKYERCLVLPDDRWFVLWSVFLVV